MIRSNEEKREDRLAVMSVAYEQFRARRSDLMKVDTNLARSIRFDAVWKAYGLARPCIHARGDVNGVRQFLPYLFGRMVSLVEADTAKALRIEQAQLEENAIVVRAEASIDASMRDLISRMTEDQRETRIRAILSEIELLPYRQGGSIAKRESFLRRELEVLFDTCSAATMNSAVTQLELLESLVGRLEPSSRLVELRERARLRTNPRTALAMAVAGAHTTGAM